MLRGCKLKNTEWVSGLVIYIGKETAIMMNSSTPFNKTSNIEKTVNKYIIAIMIFEILCSFASAGYCYYGCVKFYSFENYLFRSNPSCIQVAAISFGSYFILYSTFIPISLIVSLEFVKVFQGYFMSNDQEMYCAANKKGLECRTVSINEELGQVEYILTDKTGTLTCNKMEFRNIVIGHELYGENINLNPLEDNITYERLSSRYSEPKKED
jgi:magnesium-transporting ATPase (P-type)